MAMQMPVHYIVDLPLYQSEKLYSLSSAVLSPNDDFPRTNVQLEVHQTLLHNLRDYQGSLPFGKHNFKHTHYKARAQPEHDSKHIPAYCEEMIALLRQHVQADVYLCYDFKARKATEVLHQNSLQPVPGPHLPDTYFEAAHVDHTRNGGWHRVARHLTRAEKETYFDGTWRIRIWNMWKPTVSVVKDKPLAICDPLTVDEDDLWPCDQVGPDASGPPGEIYYLRPNKTQRWYWLPDQVAGELLIFLSWDSHPPDGKLNFCPHAAFTDPRVCDAEQRRESVEVRVLTFSRLT